MVPAAYTTMDGDRGGLNDDLTFVRISLPVPFACLRCLGSGSATRIRRSAHTCGAWRHRDGAAGAMSTVGRRSTAGWPFRWWGSG